MFTSTVLFVDRNLFGKPQVARKCNFFIKEEQIAEICLNSENAIEFLYFVLKRGRVLLGFSIWILKLFVGLLFSSLSSAVYNWKKIINQHCLGCISIGPLINFILNIWANFKSCVCLLFNLLFNK